MSQPLQQKNTRSLLTWLPLVMLVGSVIFYFILMGHIRHMKQQQLQLKLNNAWTAYTTDTTRVSPRIQGEYQIAPGETPKSFIEDSANLAWMRQTKQFNGRPYTITTIISAKEYRHLLIKVSIAEGIVFILLLVAIVVVNRFESRRLWTPFYTTMNTVRSYDIRQNRSLPLDVHTGIEEFDQLNKTLTDLIDNASRAYRNQKQFTENASHELQTPLAIIRSKVELLAEAPGLTEDTAQLLQEITEANERLSQMNKNLLLLARIENSQFPDVEPIALSALVERLSRFFRDYHENELITTVEAIQPGITITANPALIEILIGNLLRNAYVHNIPNGWANIQLTDKALTIENSGPTLDTDPERLFDRFRKGRVDNRTTGLGLALVRQIAQFYHYDIRYTYQDSQHQLTLTF